MAFENYSLDISLPGSSTDFSNSQYTAVSVNSSGQVVAPATGAPVVGVLQNNPAANQTANVRVQGVTYMIASAAINPGQLVATDANGKAKVATAATANTTTGATTGSAVIGIALDTAAAAGDYVSVLLKSFGSTVGTYA